MVILGFAGFGWVLGGFGGLGLGRLVGGLCGRWGVVGDLWCGLRVYGAKKRLCVGVWGGWLGVYVAGGGKFAPGIVQFVKFVHFAK